MDLKGEMHKCSKCGFCLGVCPVYRVTGEEGESPRGRLELLARYHAGDLSMGAVRSALDACLLCGACTGNCPQGIRTDLVVREARADWAGGLGQWFKRSLFALVGLAGGGVPRAKVSGGRIGYFPGCSNSYLFPRVATATTAAIRAAGADPVILPAVCCGLPLLAAGDRQGADVAAQRVKEVIRDAGDLDLIVTDCASCAATLRDDGIRVMDLATLLEKQGIPWVSAEEGKVVVTYHQPCHARESGEGAAAMRLLASLPGLEYREAVGYASCCGGGGTYWLGHPEVARRILAQKMDAFAATGAQILVTSCPACQLHLKLGLGRARLGLKVLNLSQLLQLRGLA